VASCYWRHPGYTGMVVETKKIRVLIQDQPLRTINGIVEARQGDRVQWTGYKKQGQKVYRIINKNEENVIY